jgi:hypothetical protein
MLAIHRLAGLGDPPAHRGKPGEPAILGLDA